MDSSVVFIIEKISVPAVRLLYGCQAVFEVIAITYKFTNTSSNGLPTSDRLIIGDMSPWMFESIPEVFPDAREEVRKVT